MAGAADFQDVPVWDAGDWKGLEPLRGVRTADVCVVGLGGSGLAAVDESLKAGKSVVGVDGGRIAGKAAGRNAGFLIAGMSMFYHGARAHWGAVKARSIYEKTLLELDEIFASPAARRSGSLRIAESDDELSDIERELAALTADGFEAEAYEGPEGRGMLLPNDGVCNPMHRCRAQVPGCIHRGSQLFECSPAVSIQSGVVQTPEGRVEADAVVVAVDGRLEQLFPSLAGRVRTARLEMLATEPLAVRFSRPVYTSFGYIYWQQLPNGRLALGGLRDRFETHSWSTDAGPTAELQRALDGYLKTLGVSARVSHRWAGHTAYTEDRAPICEQLLPGVWAVGGYCGHGNVLGAVYGRAAVRAAIDGEEPLLLCSDARSKYRWVPWHVTSKG